MTKLHKLADACNDGACNVSGLLLSLGEAVEEYVTAGGLAAARSLKDEPALKCIIGHIGYLLGESLGPSEEALRAYEESRKEIA